MRNKSDRDGIQAADAIHARLLRVKAIAMYASIQNIRQKTDAELRCRLNAYPEPGGEGSILNR